MTDRTLNELRKAHAINESAFKNKDFHEGFKEGISTAIDLIDAGEPRSEISGDDEVERVAIAICPWYGKKHSDETPEVLWAHIPAEKKDAYRAQARAAIEAISQKREIVAAIPSEEMCDRARGFILGIDLGHRIWRDMKLHLTLGGYQSCARIDTQAETNPLGHITKWDVAECIYVMMNSPTKIEDGSSNG